MRILDPTKFKGFIGKTPPPQYTALKDRIAEETRLLALHCSLENREPTQMEIAAIVSMKHALDTILMDWIDPQ